MFDDTLDKEEQRISVCRRGHERVVGVACWKCGKISRGIAWDRKMFGGNREVAIQRDGEKCVKCGMTREEHLAKYHYDITVDHIDGMGTGVPPEKKNNSLENLQTLCMPCHANKDTVLRKLNYIKAVNIRHMRNELTQGKIAELYGVHETNVAHILHDRYYKKEDNEPSLYGTKE